MYIKCTSGNCGYAEPMTAENVRTLNFGPDGEAHCRLCGAACIDVPDEMAEKFHTSEEFARFRNSTA